MSSNLPSTAIDSLLEETRRLQARVNALSFAAPVDTVYNPIDYAYDPWEAYLRRYARRGISALFVGMNPGPWGMAQTGIPFGEIGFVHDWMDISGEVGRPEPEHAKRPILGFDCERSEVSGRRLWSLMRDRFTTADAFFANHFVANYCPLVFMADSGRNVTPDKLPASEREPLFDACDDFLAALSSTLRPKVAIGIGKFAESRVRAALPGLPCGTILHPSPASPAANKDWAGTVTHQLYELGVWKP